MTPARATAGAPETGRPASAALDIRLLGELDILRDGRSPPLDSARAEWLLAYLLVHRGGALTLALGSASVNGLH
jgi:hypothetical protein